MDLFAALLLLFGAFSLGAATGGDAVDQGAAPGNPAATTEGREVRHQADYAHLPNCQAGRHDAIYRDLSRARPVEVGTEFPQPRDCSDTCPDE